MKEDLPGIGNENLFGNNWTGWWRRRIGSLLQRSRFFYFIGNCSAYSSSRSSASESRKRVVLVFLCSTVLIRTLREFDIDNALRRKPLLILVRERIPDSIFGFLLWKRLPPLKWMKTIKNVFGIISAWQNSLAHRQKPSIVRRFLIRLQGLQGFPASWSLQFWWFL